MNNDLKITKSDKKLEDFKKHLETGIVDECDALFITEEYNKNNVHLIIKNNFYKFIKENNSEINIIEYRKSIDYVEVIILLSDWRIYYLRFVVSFNNKNNNYERIFSESNQKGQRYTFIEKNNLVKLCYL